LVLTFQCSDFYRLYGRCDPGWAGVIPQSLLCISAACGL